MEPGTGFEPVYVALQATAYASRPTQHGAMSGNRTRAVYLEGRRSTIKLPPHVRYPESNRNLPVVQGVGSVPTLARP